MNSGYLSLILLCIALILVVSGWKEIFLRSISYKGILLFFMAWLVGSRIVITWGHVQMYAVYAGIALVSIGILFATRGFIQKLHLLSIGLLLGSFHFLIQQLLVMDPILIVGNPGWDTALFLAFAVTVIQRSELQQIAGLSIGCLLGELYQTSIHTWNGIHRIGGTGFQDQWWLAIFAARVLTVVVQQVYSGFQAVLERKGGWKK